MLADVRLAKVNSTSAQLLVNNFCSRVAFHFTALAKISLDSLSMFV